MEIWQGSGGPAGGPGGFRRPSQRSRRAWGSLPEVREGLGGPGGVGRPSRRSGRHWEALLEVQEKSGGPSGGPGGVRRGRDALP